MITNNWQYDKDDRLALTKTQERVAYLAAAGYKNPEIASHLRISEKTVYSHLSHIFIRLSIKKRTELVSYFASKPKPDPLPYKSSLINVSIAADEYKAEWIKKQKHWHIINAICALKYRCMYTWIPSKKEWLRELNAIMAIVNEELGDFNHIEYIAEDCDFK